MKHSDFALRGNDALADKTAARIPEKPVRVRYWWTEDGDEENCVAECVVAPVGLACDHCGASFTDNANNAIRLTCEEDGSVHTLHVSCAVRGVDGPDMAAIRSLASAEDQL